MLRKTFFLSALLPTLFVTTSFADIAAAPSLLHAEEPADTMVTYPLMDYAEPRVGTVPSQQWQTLAEGLHATWASRDVHYELHKVPEVVGQETIDVYGWQGERLGVQALLYSKTDQGVLSLRMSKWKKGRKKVAIESTARFVNYVITDDYKAKD